MAYLFTESNTLWLIFFIEHEVRFFSETQCRTIFWVLSARSAVVVAVSAGSKLVCGQPSWHQRRRAKPADKTFFYFYLIIRITRHLLSWKSYVTITAVAAKRTHKVLLRPPTGSSAGATGATAPGTAESVIASAASQTTVTTASDFVSIFSPWKK